MDLLLAGGISLTAFDVGFLIGAWWGGFWRKADRPVVDGENGDCKVND